MTTAFFMSIFQALPVIISCFSGTLSFGGDGMKEKKTAKTKKTVRQAECLRLDPEKRLCPQFDSTGIRMFPVASWDQMGFQVLDNFCQEHIM